MKESATIVIKFSPVSTTVNALAKKILNAAIEAGMTGTTDYSEEKAIKDASFLIGQNYLGVCSRARVKYFSFIDSVSVDTVN